MIESLKYYKCDVKVIDIIAKLYRPTGDMITLNIGGKKVCDMEVTNGIRQGCTGSSQLFLMVLNIIKKIIKAEIGFKNECVYITALFFADDVLLITNTVEEITQIIEILKNMFIISGLEINKEKSFCMVFCKKEKPSEIQEIKVVQDIKYLGVKICDKRECFQLHKKDKIKQGRNLANMIYCTQ